jgi:uncharacterized protein (DUF4213/DUF364 family)
MLLDELKIAALEKAGTVKLRDVRIGLIYTAVELDTGSVGLAYRFGDRSIEPGNMWPAVGRPLRETLDGLTSENLLERTVGLAAANAMFNTAESASIYSDWTCVSGDLLDVLGLSKDDRVGMVGYFAPLAPVIKQRAGELIVFDEHTERAEGLLPGSRAAELLPSCSVVIITATSIINRSFEHIAAAADGSRIKAVLGPSTPLVPEVFKGYGITHLSGIIAQDPAAVLRIVSEGGGTRVFMKWSKKINLILDA